MSDAANDERLKRLDAKAAAADMRFGWAFLAAVCSPFVFAPTIFGDGPGSQGSILGAVGLMAIGAALAAAVITARDMFAAKRAANRARLELNLLRGKGEGRSG